MKTIDTQILAYRTVEAVYRKKNILTDKQYTYTMFMTRFIVVGLTIGAIAGIAILLLR